MTTSTYVTPQSAACDNSKLSGAKQEPPPAKNRVWKAPRQLPERLAHEASSAIYVLWRYGSMPNGRGKYPKIPFNPHTGKKADTTDPATWGTFAECLERADAWRGWFDGIGRILMPGEVGIDLDDCYDAGGALSPLAAGLVDEATGYKENSVSGGGLHIIVEGQVAEAIKTDAIEIYPGGSGRYFVLTGHELESSARPAPAQPLVNWLVQTYGAERVKSGQRAAATPRHVETVALTAELSSDLTSARARLPELLQRLRSNMTPQLYALLKRGEFPPAMKDTSASGARAVIVAQLQRAPKERYNDAEVYTLARELWRRKGYEGAMAGRERLLDADCWRLIASYRPGAPARQKRAYSPAPAPLAYLERMVTAATAGEVLLTRHERAALAGVPRATAQRTEERLVAEGLAELATYALPAPERGRRGLLRITAAGLRALGLQDESVNFRAPAPDETVTNRAPESAETTIDTPKNTLVCGGGEPEPASTHHPRVLSPAGGPPALVDEPPALERLVALALDDDGRASLAKVRRYLADNGLADRWPESVVARIYRQELKRRARARQELERQQIAAMDLSELNKERKSAERHMASGLALQPQRRPEESDERHAARVKRWRADRAQFRYWQSKHVFVCEVIARKRAALVDTPLLELLERHELAAEVAAPAAPVPGSAGYSAEEHLFADGRIAWRLYDDATGEKIADFDTLADAERYVANGWPQRHAAWRAARACGQVAITA